MSKVVLISAPSKELAQRAVKQFGYEAYTFEDIDVFSQRIQDLGATYVELDEHPHLDPVACANMVAIHQLKLRSVGLEKYCATSNPDVVVFKDREVAVPDFANLEWRRLVDYDKLFLVESIIYVGREVATVYRSKTHELRDYKLQPL